MANRLPLEEQTGADLIYFNETHRSFVMVQYKALEKGDEEPEFRWSDGDLFTREIERMHDLLKELSQIDPDTDPDGFRFSSNPFFLKLSPKSSSILTTDGCFPACICRTGSGRRFRQASD